MASSSSKTEAPGTAAPLPATVVVARFLRARGLRGELIAEVLTDVPGRLKAGAKFQLTGERRPAREVEIASVSPHPQGALVRLVGVETRDAADGVRGGVLEIERPKSSPRPKGSYFEYELVGCQCGDGAGETLGVLVAVDDGGGGPLLRIEGERGELLVPFVESFLKSVDIAGRRIELVLPPGLLETCVSRS